MHFSGGGRQALEIMETSSDSMIDIQIEESLVRESLMTIDTANFMEDILTLGGFFLIVVLSALTGLYGPPSARVVQKEHIIEESVHKDELHYQSYGLSSLNRYISFSILVRRRDMADDMTGHLSVGYVAECTSDGVLVRHSQRMFESVPFHARQHANSSTEVRIYTDRIVNYDQIHLRLSIEGDLQKYSHVVIRCVTGDSDYTVFQIYFRLVFSIFVSMFLVGLLWKLWAIPYKLWHLEQKLTIPLLLLDFIFCNPLYALQAHRPTQNFIYLRTISNALFTSYFHFFVLALFDSLRYKNRRTDHCFFGPKVTFLIIQFLVIAFHGVTYDFVSFGAAPFGGDKVDHALAHLEALMSAVYYLWVIWSVAIAAYQVDVTEQYKFNMYLATVSSSLLVLGIGRIFFSYFEWFTEKSIYFTVSFAVQNAFVILMAHYHWPYEVFRDHGYVDSTADSSETNTQDFW